MFHHSLKRVLFLGGVVMGEFILQLPVFRKRQSKICILIGIDVLLIVFAYLLAFVFRYYIEGSSLYSIFQIFNDLKYELLIASIILITCQWIMKQYQSIWTLAGIEDFILGIGSFILGTVLNLFVSFLLPYRVPLLVTVLAGIFAMLFCNGARIEWRLFRRSILYNHSSKVSENPNTVLIYGAGAAGRLVMNEYQRNPQLGKKIIGFIDDNAEKVGNLIGNRPVIGTYHDLERIVEDYDVNEIVVAISSMDRKKLKSVFLSMQPYDVKVKIMPGLFELIDRKFNIDMIHEIQVEELLERETIKLDHYGISEYIENQVVMVTGGGGSIGSELCRQIVKFNPKQLIILDIYENNAYDLQNELLQQYPNINLVTLIASVRDWQRLERIYQIYRPNVVFHAAAHKHVPLMEVSPSEAIKNNVVGTLNTAELASVYNVKRFVLISTDKAVNPTNVMGATKRLCEIIIQAINVKSETEFVAVRFGNVLGSNGSVVPLFKRQIAKGGPVTLTHKEITRYFMTIPEAAQLVLQAGGFAQGGEIFVLDMGKPVKIYDLAKNLIRLSGYEPDVDIPIEITGLRPGEKLYEELLMEEEGLQKTRHEKIFIGQPGNFDLEVVKEQINELLEIATTRSISELKSKLKEVVPTYEEPKHHKVG